MNTDLVRDILLKAAEDVTQGMWCKGQWFADHEDVWTKYNEGDNAYAVYGNLSVEAMQRTERCAEGSLILSTRLLGGDANDYDHAVDAVLHRAFTEGRINSWSDKPYGLLFDLNDDLPDNPFTAGQALAELFRSTAEAL